MIMQVILVAFGCAVLLSRLSWFTGKMEESSAAAAALTENHPQQAELRSDNLVDELISWELLVPIDRVELSQHILAIDFKITAEAGQSLLLYQGLSHAIACSFEKTSNINRLLVRFVAEDQWLGNKYLLLAADVRRGEWPNYALEELRAWGNRELSHELKSWFRVTETNLWKTMISK
ncbi:hypothetical protein D3C77_540750 [compost metagenome]